MGSRQSLRCWLYSQRGASASQPTARPTLFSPWRHQSPQALAMTSPANAPTKLPQASLGVALFTSGLWASSRSPPCRACARAPWPSTCHRNPPPPTHRTRPTRRDVRWRWRCRGASSDLRLPLGPSPPVRHRREMGVPVQHSWHPRIPQACQSLRLLRFRV
jgi:hypothetical protein